jgi:molybdopterin-guanine dinucleotide biosynthesis protein A
MGQDKALIEIRGVPLLQHICQVACSCCHPVYVVTPRVEQYRPLLPPGCRCIAEVFTHAKPDDGLLDKPDEKLRGKPHGPLVGFAQGLASVQTDWLLLLACDLANLDGETVQTWLGQLAQVPPTAIAFLPRHAKGWEPLCGFYHRRCGDSLQRFVAAGGRSFQRWLAQETVHPFIHPLTVTDPRVLLNCNQPEDLQQCLDPNLQS